MTGRWVGIWSAAPQSAEPADLPPRPFTRDGLALPDSTLRQTIRVSAAARRIRLRLSNAFGAAELHVGRVCVALPAGGRAGVSAIAAGIGVAGTPVELTFAGHPGAHVPPGAEAVSDPFDFSVAAAANVSVSLWLPTGQPVGAGITAHAGSRTTSFVAPGDQAGDPDLDGADRVEHWYFLAGVDAHVKRSVAGGTGVLHGPSAAVAFLGDSLTDGRGSTTNGNDRWPDQLLDRMLSGGGTGSMAGRDADGTFGVALLNQGIGGNRVLRDGLGPTVIDRLDRDVLAVSGVRWLTLFVGVNDIGGEPARPAAQRQVAAELCAAYEKITARAHAADISVICATLTPFGGNALYDDPAGHREATRQSVNAWIRGRGGFDHVLDFDAAARDPVVPRRLQPRFDSGDHLHLSPAGYRALANAVPANLFRHPPDPSLGSKEERT